MQTAEEKEYLLKGSKAIFGAGIILFALSLLNGFMIQAVAIPRLGLSAHLIGLIGASFLIGIGSYWPRLNLGIKLSRIGMLLVVYSFWSGWAVYFFAAASGAGKMFPIASGNQSGAPFVEGLISLAMMSFALAFFVSIGIIIRGLFSAKKA
jgi:hydroxylaminobenzene mutase